MQKNLSYGGNKSFFDKERERLGISSPSNFFEEERRRMNAGQKTKFEVGLAETDRFSSRYGEDSVVPSRTEKTGNDLSNLQHFVRGAGNVIDGLVPFGDPVKKGLVRDIDSPWLRDTFRPAESTGQKAVDVINDIGGSLPMFGGAYKGASKFLDATKGINTLTKQKPKLDLLEEAQKGSMVGAAYGVQDEVGKAFSGDSQGFRKATQNIALETGLGAIGDPALMKAGQLIGKGISKLRTPEIPKADSVTSNIPKLVEEPKQDLVPFNVMNKSPELPNARPLKQEPRFDRLSDKPLNIEPMKEPSLKKVKEFKNPFETTDNTIPNTKTQLASKVTKEKPNVKDMFEKTVINSVDNLYRFKQLDNYVESVTGKKLSPSERSYMLALNSRGTDMISRTITTENLVNHQGETIGKSLKDITENIPKGKLTDFEDYLINKHAITRMGRGEKVFENKLNMTPEKAKTIVEQYEKNNPQFKKLSEQFYEFRNKLGKAWLVDTGIIPEKEWEGYVKENPFYVPNQRLFQDIEKPRFKGTKSGFGNQTSPVKKATGSQRKIISPIESTIEHIAQYVKTAKRNEVAQTLVKQIQENPKAFEGWAEIVPTEKNPGAFMDSLESTFKEKGVEGVLEDFNKAFEQKPDLTNGNIITALVDGQKVHLKVYDPHLLDAMTHLGPKARSIVINSIGQATRVMKNLTTGINPIFSLTRNVFRDIPTAYINSKTTNNPIHYSVDLIDAILSVVKNDDLYKSFKAVGGGHSSPVASDVNLLAQSKRSILPERNVKDLGGKLIGTLENLNNAVESAPRLAEFKRIKQSGDYDSIVKGLYEANDITVNFSKFGNVAKEVDAVVPYLNAAIQGLDKLQRVYRDNPAQAIAKSVGAITIPTLMLYAINRNNPEYQRISKYNKDTYFLIPTEGETFVRIPKPRETGVIFGAGVERVLDSWFEKDPEAFQYFADTIKSNFMVPTRTIAAPFSDIRANKSFTGSPIVPGDLQNLSPKFQYDYRTSEVSKKIGDVLNVSPKKLDYLASSYGGILADIGIPLTTKGTGLGETLKRQVTVDPEYSNDSLRKFYDAKTELDTARQNYTKMGETENLNEPLRKFLGRVSREISDVRKQQKNVLNDLDIPAKERQLQARELQKRINELSEMANSYVERR